MSNGSARDRVVLVVLDGWGYRAEREGNAIELADTPVWHRLWNVLPAHPARRQRARGRPPRGTDGQQRSRATSTSAPAGWCRRTWCASPRASRAASSTSCRRWSSCAPRSGRPAARCTWSACSGPGGVHALDRHLLACVELGVRLQVPAIAIHGFLDGRDSAPDAGRRGGADAAADMRRIAGTRVDIASLTGRYFGMDRDRRWDRTRLAYDAMVHGVGTPVDHPVLAVQAAYQRGETDEFIQPLVHHRERRAGRHDARRRRRPLLQLSQRPDAPDRRARSRVDGFDGFDAGATARGSRASP